MLPTTLPLWGGRATLWENYRSKTVAPLPSIEGKLVMPLILKGWTYFVPRYSMANIYLPIIFL